MMMKRFVLFVVIAMFAILSIAVIGARGTGGFSRGSVVGWGEIWGKIAKESYMTLEVAPHPDETGDKEGILTLIVFCGTPGNSKIAPGINPIEAEVSFVGEGVPTEGLERIKRGVILPGEDDPENGLLRALDSEADMDYLNSISSDNCPNPNWHIVDAYPIGFKAIIRVYDSDPELGNADIDQEFEAVCGVTSDNYDEVSDPFELINGIATEKYICTNLDNVKPGTNPID